MALKLAPQVFQPIPYQGFPRLSTPKANMCENTMTHFTCIWCKQLYDSRMEQIICNRAHGSLGACGKMSGANKSVYNLFCPNCPSEKYKKGSYRDPRWICK